MPLARIIPRRAFNNRIDLAKAYTWNRKDVSSFSSNVSIQGKPKKATSYSASWISGTDAWEFWNHERSREGRGTLRRPDHEIQVRPLDPCLSSLILSNPRSTHDPPKRGKAARTYTKHQAFQLRQLRKASHLHQARTKRQADP